MSYRLENSIINKDTTEYNTQLQVDNAYNKDTTDILNGNIVNNKILLNKRVITTNSTTKNISYGYVSWKNFLTHIFNTELNLSNNLINIDDVNNYTDDVKDDTGKIIESNQETKDTTTIQSKLKTLIKNSHTLEQNKFIFTNYEITKGGNNTDDVNKMIGSNVSKYVDIINDNMGEKGSIITKKCQLKMASLQELLKTQGQRSLTGLKAITKTIGQIGKYITGGLGSIAEGVFSNGQFLETLLKSGKTILKQGLSTISAVQSLNQMSREISYSGDSTIDEYGENVNWGDINYKHWASQTKLPNFGNESLVFETININTTFELGKFGLYDTIEEVIKPSICLMSLVYPIIATETSIINSQKSIYSYLNGIKNGIYEKQKTKNIWVEIWNNIKNNLSNIKNLMSSWWDTGEIGILTKYLYDFGWDITIGTGIHYYNCIPTGIELKYSNDVDENGLPISVKVSLSFTSISPSCISYDKRSAVNFRLGTDLPVEYIYNDYATEISVNDNGEITSTDDDTLKVAPFKVGATTLSSKVELKNLLSEISNNWSESNYILTGNVKDLYNSKESINLETGKIIWTEDLQDIGRLFNNKIIFGDYSAKLIKNIQNTINVNSSRIEFLINSKTIFTENNYDWTILKYNNKFNELQGKKIYYVNVDDVKKVLDNITKIDSSKYILYDKNTSIKSLLNTNLQNTLTASNDWKKVSTDNYNKLIELLDSSSLDDLKTNYLINNNNNIYIKYEFIEKKIGE